MTVKGDADVWHAELACNDLGISTLSGHG